MQFPFNALGLSHKWIFEHVKNGDLCIDATCGKGRDTLFLSKLVGNSGHVFAFDIQKEAIEQTKALLKSEGCENVTVIWDCHSKLTRYIHRDVAAIMFNFGWLPGGDHNVFSLPETSIAALRAGLDLLSAGGIITLCIYYGKETGYAERDALLSYLKTLDQGMYSVLKAEFVNRKNEPPIAVLIRKE